MARIINIPAIIHSPYLFSHEGTGKFKKLAFTKIKRPIINNPKATIKVGTIPGMFGFILLSFVGKAT